MSTAAVQCTFLVGFLTVSRRTPLHLPYFLRFGHDDLPSLQSFVAVSAVPHKNCETATIIVHFSVHRDSHTRVSRKSSHFQPLLTYHCLLLDKERQIKIIIYLVDTKTPSSRWLAPRRQGFINNSTNSLHNRLRIRTLS